MKHALTLCKPALTLFMSVLAASATTLAADVSGSDKSFIQDEYKDGLAEVKLAELAQGKTANAEVKTFATQMATDHGKANAELKALAATKNVEVASEPSVIAKGRIKMLDAKSGAEFDKDWVESMIKEHKDAVKDFEKAANEAKDAEVKAFATKTLPTLKHHLSTAEGLLQKLPK
jgi:putative membrane protein